MKVISKEQILLDLAKYYSVDMELKSHDVHASVDLLTDKITLNFNQTISLELLLSSFFHELAHLYCKYLNKYPLYHSDTFLIQKDKQSAYLRTIWRAEVFVDQMGKKMMKDHYPEVRCVMGYTNKTKKYFHKESVEQFKKHFDYINNMPKNKNRRNK